MDDTFPVAIPADRPSRVIVPADAMMELFVTSTPIVITPEGTSFHTDCFMDDNGTLCIVFVPVTASPTPGPA